MWGLREDPPRHTRRWLDVPSAKRLWKYRTPDSVTAGRILILAGVANIAFGLGTHLVLGNGGIGSSQGNSLHPSKVRPANRGLVDSGMDSLGIHSEHSGVSKATWAILLGGRMEKCSKCSRQTKAGTNAKQQKVRYCRGLQQDGRLLRSARGSTRALKGTGYEAPR